MDHATSTPDPEHRLIAAVLDTGRTDLLDPAVFTSKDGKAVAEFILAHEAEYGRVPQLDSIENHLRRTGVVKADEPPWRLVPPGTKLEPPGFYVARLAEERRQKAVIAAIGTLADGGEVWDWAKLAAGTAAMTAALNGSSNGHHALAWETAKEFCVQTPAEPIWLVPDLVAEGAITEIIGKIKNGKSSFVLAMLYSVATGTPFLGRPVVQSPVVYLSEMEGPALATALAEAGLDQLEDFHLLRWSKSRGLSWPQLVGEAQRRCEDVGGRLMVVDTTSRFAGLKGREENDSGFAAETMSAMKMAAAAGLGACSIRHGGKSADDSSVEDMARGSSNWGGEVDIIVGLRKVPSFGKNCRSIEVAGRFGLHEPLIIERLTDGSYLTRGDAAVITREHLVDEVWAALPYDEEEAMSSPELVDQLGKRRIDVLAALEELHQKGLVSRRGRGRKGDPHLWWQVDAE